jgi:ABC-type ATPase with predicted acetyltransferase domain
MNELAVTLEASFATAVEPSRRVCEVAAMFGLGVDRRKEVQVLPPTTLRLAPGRLLFVTGASGGGKTTLLRKLAESVRGNETVRVIDFQTLESAQDRPLVESLPGSLEQTIRWLSLAGLNDAFVMLRKPSELSDGQRYRFRLSQAMALAENPPAEPGADRWALVFADEFGATLDRLTAQVIARNVRKWVTRSRCCFVAATTHDDLLEALDPDTLIVQHPGRAIEVLEQTPLPRGEGGGVLPAG